MVALLLIQMQGTWLVFKLQQTAIRHEVKQQIKAGVPASDLVVLRIAKVWEETHNARFEREHSKEFRFDGEMYDIISSQDEGDTTVYVCIHDVKESGLFANLDCMIETEANTPINKKSRQSLEQLIAAKYVQESLVFNVPLQETILIRSDFSNIVSTEQADVNNPPPEVLS